MLQDAFSDHLDEFCQSYILVTFGSKLHLFTPTMGNAEISAKITKNGHFRPKIEHQQMCLLCAYTAPQNLVPKSMLPYLSDHAKTLGHSRHIFLTPDYKSVKIALFGD